MRRFKGYIFDLDGTIYLGPNAIPGAPETIAELRASGAKVVFLSNKPIEAASTYAAKLTKLGMPTTPAEVLNSSIVMARYLSRTAPGCRVYLIGEEPLAHELRQRGIQIVTDPMQAQYVVTSWDRQFTYQKLDDALQAIKRAGAKFIATHPDRTCPVEGGEVADVGGMIGAIEGVTGRKVELITGKPSPVTLQEALDLLGLPKEECIMIGDRLETDVRMGKEAGMAAAVVLTGVSCREDAMRAEWKPDYVLDSVAGLVGKARAEAI
ncbi:MAG TPA: HAD-IIA family hydrolase [Symbiobacteriaceae bacterium]|jgi:phosphoglycolate/pyridoxal phosphate phosphatase family enzyme|nr:HAD-IIA family hydrolase [Symbiobacteriaceae bacterium]